MRKVQKEGVDDAFFRGAGLANFFGDKFMNAPRHTVGIRTRYAFPALNSAIAGGMDFVDDRVNFDFGGPKPVPNYTVFDVSWKTEWRGLNLQLNIRNLFDEEHAVSGIFPGSFPGEPRTVVFRSART